MLMQKYLNDCDLIIFDLDGTLYEDTDHFDYYAEQLKQYVAPEKQATFLKDYQLMKNGEHPVSIGKAYDVNHDVALTLDPLTLAVTDVHNWDGTNWSLEKVKETYPDTISFDFESVIAIGDGWWLPFSSARHHGVTGEQTYKAYTATKDFMVTDQFQLTKTPGLKEGLKKLKNEKYIVLVTNSEEDDVKRLLQELDLEGLFHEVITSAQKPVQTSKIFKDVIDKYQVSAEKVISVGDNFINEIAPALLAGMKAVYIQPQGINYEHENLEVIHSLEDVFSNKS